VCFFQALNTPKLVFGRGSAPDPAKEAHDDPDAFSSSRLGRGHPIRRGHPLPMSFPFDALGVSISALSAPRLSGPQHVSIFTKMLSEQIRWFSSDIARSINSLTYNWKNGHSGDFKYSPVKRSSRLDRAI